MIRTIGRMLLGSAIRRTLWRSPRAWLIVAAVAGLALMSIGTARAGTYGCNSGQRCTIEAARSACETHVASLPDYLSPGRCDNSASMWVVKNRAGNEVGGGAGRYYYSGTCPPDAPWDEASKTCKQACTSRPDVTVTRPPFAPAGMGSPGSFGQCSGGCYVHYTNMHDGTFVGVHTSNAQCGRDGLPDTDTCTAVGRVSGPWGCVDPPKECAAGQVKDPLTGECKGSNCPAGMNVNALGECQPEADTCPPGQIKSPAGGCLPGEGQCAAGEARGKDGTCKRDSNNDGTPDEEEEGSEDGEDGDGDMGQGDKSEFSGGDTCSSPPSCSGNPILCGQARIQWRIDCNTRTKVNITGGTCGATPICVGENCNAMEYAQLLQQWRTACALEKLGQGVPGSSNAQPEWTKVGGMSQDPGAGAGSGDEPRLSEHVVDGSSIQTTGFIGGGGSCPAFGFATAGGSLVDRFAATINAPGPAWCQWIGYVYAIITTFGMISALVILARGS